MKTFIIILSIIVISAGLDLTTLVVNGNIKPNEEVAFEIYKQHKANGYKGDKYFGNFLQNLKKIHEINKDKTNTWTAGINKFAFMSTQEFTQSSLGAQDCSNVQFTAKKIFQALPNVAVPAFKDWRDEGVVTPVRDQQNCSSSWAFAAIGAMESQWALNTKAAPEIFSEQQLVDCSNSFNNDGCNSGLPSQAFDYIKSNGGVEYGGVYMYEAAPLPSGCDYSADSMGATFKGGAVNLQFQDENALLQAVATIGPIAVVFQADESFKTYTGGIYSSTTCSNSPSAVNHSALIVGYGSENSQNYWIAKNSWGDSWGENGYFRIARGSNMCGIANCASYPEIYSQE